MVYITRRAHFSASHRLYNPEYSHEQNDEIFDKCNNVHGHNYIVDVTVAGTPDVNTGYVLDLKILKRIMDEEIIEKVDHHHLNDVDFMRGIIPSAENLAIMFWQKLESRLPQGALNSIKVFESDNNFVEYKGEPVQVHRFQVSQAEDAQE